MCIYQGENAGYIHSYSLKLVINLQQCTSILSLLPQDVVMLMEQNPSASYSLLSQVIITAFESILTVESLTVGAKTV